MVNKEQHIGWSVLFSVFEFNNYAANLWLNDIAPGTTQCTESGKKRGIQELICAWAVIVKN